MNQSRNKMMDGSDFRKDQRANSLMTLESHQFVDGNRNHDKIDFDRLNAEQLRQKNRERLQAL